MKRIYISGCGGMLGEAFYKEFKDDYYVKCTDKDVNSSWLGYLDIRNFDTYHKDVTYFAPDYLFHLGAYTDLEFCERNPEETYITNTLSVEHAVYIANELNIPILYISSAGIFNGKQVYDDWDQPIPTGVYARSKYLGERFVIENARKYFVIRAGWMMGGGRKKDKKFIQKIVHQIDNGANELFIVNDKFGTPTYTHDFAKNTKLLIETGFYGVYNMVCEGLTSRLEVAQELINLLDNKVNINLVNSDYFKKEYFAPRPESEQLINYKLNLRGINIMRDWKIVLKEYIQNYDT